MSIFEMRKDQNSNLVPGGGDAPLIVQTRICADRLSTYKIAPLSEKDNKNNCSLDKVNPQTQMVNPNLLREMNKRG